MASPLCGPALHGQVPPAGPVSAPSSSSHLSPLPPPLLLQDTNPAFVCDLESRAALQRLVEMKGIAPSKSLSILVRNWADVSKV